MQTVYLEGNLAKFGDKWETSCNNVGEILRLIECQTSGFRKHLIDAHEAGIEFQIKRGKDILSEEELLLTLHDDDIVITELPAGADGVGKLLAAVVLVVLAFTVGGLTFGAGFTASLAGNVLGATLLLAGTSLAMMGISEMMMPDPSVDGTDNNKNYLFSGPANTVAQGQAVPLAYGELIVGGAPISLSYSRTPITVDGGEVGGTTGTTVAPKEKVNTLASDNVNTKPTPARPVMIPGIDIFFTDEEARQIRLTFQGHFGIS
jgi:predicted phage tail protein